MPDPTSRRRPLQFSLRAILIVVVGFAIIFRFASPLIGIALGIVVIALAFLLLGAVALAPMWVYVQLVKSFELRHPAHDVPDSVIAAGGVASLFVGAALL